MSSLIIALRCFQNTLSELDINKLLYLVIALLNSSVKNRAHTNINLDENSFKMSELICQFYTELNNWWSACYRLSSSMQGYQLYHRASIAESFCFLTQFMSSQGFWFFDIISWILSLKNNHFVFLTVLLNIFQSSNCLDILYFASLDWQSSLHQALECLVILTHFEYLYQITSDLFVNSWTASLREFLFNSFSVSIFLIAFISLAMNLSFSSLFLIIVHYLSRTNFLMMEILTINGAWSDKYQSSE